MSMICVYDSMCAVYTVVQFVDWNLTIQYYLVGLKIQRGESDRVQSVIE